MLSTAEDEAALRHADCPAQHIMVAVKVVDIYIFCNWSVEKDLVIFQ